MSYHEGTYAGDYRYSYYDESTPARFYSFEVIDKTKTSYADLPDTIEGRIPRVSHLFMGCSNLITAPRLPSTLYTGTVGDNLWGTFSDCSSLTSITNLPISPNSYYSLCGTFYNCSSLTSVPSQITSNPNKYFISGKCFAGSGITSFPTCSIAGFSTNDITTVDAFVGSPFDNTELTTVGDITCSSSMNLNGIFNGITTLETVGNLSGTNGNLTEAFKDCSALETIGNITLTGTVGGASNMCEGCDALVSTGAISLGNNSTCSLESMFEGCEELTTTSITATACGSMLRTFANCIALTTISLSIGSCSTMNQSFYGCVSLVNGPTLPSTTDMTEVYCGCSALQSASIPTGVSNLTRAFYNCANLRGSITINSSPTSYNNIFNAVVLPCVLTGSGTNLLQLANTCPSHKIAVYNIGVIPYSISAVRCEQDGTESTEGTYVKVSLSGTPDVINSNRLWDIHTYVDSVETFDPIWKLNNTTISFPLTLTSSHCPITVSSIFGGSFSPSSAYTLNFTFVDDFATSSQITIEVPTAFMTMDIAPGGTSIAFGGEAPTITQATRPYGLTTFETDVNVKHGFLVNGVDIMGLFYPVGCIYQTTDVNFDPNVEWFGTWSRIEGRVLVGYDASDTYFNTVGNQGGAKGAWKHRHKLNAYQAYASTSGYQYYYQNNTYGNVYTQYEGSENNTLDKEIANMPPYEVVVIWKRTA